MASVQTMDDGAEPQVFAEINMIPFIDVALVLLIIFMVISPMLVQAGMKMDLPSAATAAPTQDDAVQVSLSPDGQAFFEDKAVTLEELQTLVKERLAEQPDALFLVRADGDSRYHKVIRLADNVRQAGGTRLAFATDVTTMEATPGQEQPSALPDSP